MKRDRNANKNDADSSPESPRKQCQGFGDCLMQTDHVSPSGNVVLAKDPDYDCAHNCTEVQCPNFAICGTTAPEWILNTHRGLCMNCEIMFGTWNGGKGKLTIVEKLDECPICMGEGLLGVSLPRCDHTVCVPCFRRLMYGEEVVYPKFPIEGEGRQDEYFDYVEQVDLVEQQDNGEEVISRPDWLDDDSFRRILEWELLTNAMHEEQEMKQESEEHLRKCPLCRK